MIIRRTKNSMYDIQKLRTIYNTSSKAINISEEKISLLQSFLIKLKIKNFFIRVFTLFFYSYRGEVISLCKDEIQEEKKKIENTIVTFEHITSPTTHTLDKLKTVYNQLKKMKVFYQLDGTFYSYDQIDLNDFEKHNFSFTKKDNRLFIEDDLHVYDFNSLFIGKHDSNKKNTLLEMFSSDNVSIEDKTVYFYSKTKRPGLKLKLETWLYHLPDGSKDLSFSENPQIFVYGFKFIKITFNSKSAPKEFAFLGNDYDKMDLFNRLLHEYLEDLAATHYEVVQEKQYTSLTQKKIMELFSFDSSYSWVIFDILLNNKDLKTIKVSDIYRKYHLDYNDLTSIVGILKKYHLVEISLAMELIPKYKMSDIQEMHNTYILSFKENLIKGEVNG